VARRVLLGRRLAHGANVTVSGCHTKVGQLGQALKGDCDAVFRAWNRRRQLGSSDVFERRASGMGELATKESIDDEKRKTPTKTMGKLD
jgi:hypothetical protein